MTPDEPPDDDAILDGIVEELLASARGGAAPNVEAMAARHPRLADRIRRLVPALFAMERAAAPDRDGAAHLPNRLGEFRIVRFLGGGSMGMVYEAVRETEGASPDRRYAVKILLPGRTRHDLDRFRQEASSTDRLRHPNIVPIHGIFESNGLHYLVMDLIRGEGANRTIAELRARRDADPPSPSPPMTHDSFFGIPESSVREPDQPSIADRLADAPAPEAHRLMARIALQVADALAHAHRHGVVHRDVKPSNILLDRNLKAWIADFGLAKVDRADNLTRRGEVVGTLRYLAPERFRGDSRPACDIYGLGVTLYELLTLRPAFPQADLPELQHAVLFQAPPPPRIVDPNIPRELETIVLRAIEREPRRRYPSMEAFRDDLQRFLDGLPPLARRPSPRVQLQNWLRTNPALAAACALILVGTLAATAIFARQNWRLAAALADSESRIALARRNQLDAMLQQAGARVRGRGIGRRYETLELLDAADRFAREIGRRAAIDAELRDLTIAALAAPDLQAAPTGDRWAAGARAFEIDPDARRYGWIDATGALAVQRFGGAAPIVRIAENDYVEFAFLAGPRMAARTARGELHVLPVGGDPATGRVVIRDVADWSAAPGAERFAVRHANGDLACHRADDGRALSRVRCDWPGGNDAGAWMLALHPTRPIVAAARQDHDGSVFALDATSGAVRRVATDAGRPTALAWHPDGGSLFVARGEPATRMSRYDAERGYERMTTWPTDDAVTQIAIHPDGLRLAATGAAKIAAIYVVESGHAILESPPCEELGRLRWSKSGQRLAGFASSGTLQLWNCETGRELRTFQAFERGAPIGVATPHFQSGERIVLANAGERCAVWDVRSGRPLRSLPTPGVSISSHSRDGELLLLSEEGLFPTERLTIAFDEKSRDVSLAFDGTLPLPAPLMAQTPNGRVQVGGEPRSGRFWIARDGALSPWRMPEAAKSVALAPDGRHAATRGAKSLTVWDLGRREPIAELAEPMASPPRFSPDGRWLWTGSSKGDLLDTDRWQSRANLGDGSVSAAFLNDGSTIAVSFADGRVRLFESATGHALATLEHPQRLALTDLLATSDGNFLFGVSQRPDRGLHVWDLTLVRRRLRERERDWSVGR